MNKYTYSEDELMALYVQAHFERRDKKWIADQLGVPSKTLWSRFETMVRAGVKFPPLTRESNTIRGYEPHKVAHWNKLIDEKMKEYKQTVVIRANARH